MCLAEKQFLRNIGPRYIRTDLRNKFIIKRKIFDKALRGAERSYNRNKIMHIESVCTPNPREFWQKLKNL